MKPMITRNRTIPGFTATIVTTLLLLSLFLVGTATAGQARPQAVSAPALNSPIGELEAVLNNARDIYEFAKLNKWKHMGSKLMTLKKAAQSHPLAANTTNPDSLLPKLAETISDLEHAIASQQRLDSMIYANRITIISAKMSAPLTPRIPTNLLVIAYCARKLEILAETRHVDTMTEIVYKIHLSWQPLIPQVIEHGGSKEIKKFAEAMKRLEAARTAADYARQAAMVLEEVAVLEQIFTK